MLPVKKPKMEHVQADHELFLQAFESEYVGGFEGRKISLSQRSGIGTLVLGPPSSPGVGLIWEWREKWVRELFCPQGARPKGPRSLGPLGKVE